MRAQAPATGAPRARRTPTPRPRERPSPRSLAHEALDALTSDRRRWRDIVRWLSGKTIHLHLLTEAGAAVTLEKGTLRIRVGRSLPGQADLVLAAKRRVLVDLLEGRETPSSALFKGQLRVAGRSEDLVRIHDFFLHAVDRLSSSRRLRRLYATAKQHKVPKGPLVIEIRNLRGPIPQLGIDVTGEPIPGASRRAVGGRRP